MDGNPPAVPIRPLLPTRAKFAQIVQAANGGDSKALSELRRLLNEHPAIWRNVGDLASLAGTLLLRSASGGNSLIGGSITRYIRQLRTELTNPAPSRLERLAVERVLICWVQAHVADAMVASLTTTNQRTTSSWLKRQSQASRQFDAAVKSLATLRKLLPAAERSPGKLRRA